MIMIDTQVDDWEIVLSLIIWMQSAHDQLEFNIYLNACMTFPRRMQNNYHVLKPNLIGFRSYLIFMAN